MAFFYFLWKSILDSLIYYFGLKTKEFIPSLCLYSSERSSACSCFWPRPPHRFWWLRWHHCVSVTSNEKQERLDDIKPSAYAGSSGKFCLEVSGHRSSFTLKSINDFHLCECGHAPPTVINKNLEAELLFEMMLIQAHILILKQSQNTISMHSGVMYSCKKNICK